MGFLGGGTDYPVYFNEYPGAILGTAINKFIYIAALPLAGFAEQRYRITYRTVESVDRVEDIRHNVVRATLQEYGYDEPLNIAILADLPGNTGLGSSSSFTVGFIRLIEHFRGGAQLTKLDLARKAVHIEHDILHENVGIQDQTHAAFGGLNLYSFHRDDFTIRPVRMTTECREALNASMCLVFTGIQRSASDALKEQMSNTREKKIVKELGHLLALCQDGVRILEGRDAEAMLRDFGRLLSEGWETKKMLSSAISNARIDELYELALGAGAYGGKLCGAGGGGFLLFLAPPEAQGRIADAVGASNFVKIESEESGASVIMK